MSSEPRFGLKLWYKVSPVLLPVFLALAFASVLLLGADANPLEAFGSIVSGAFGGVNNITDVAMSMVPLMLCSAGMLITFAAGLWNIGIEGQIIAGAIGATFVVQTFPDITSPALFITLVLLGGVVGGVFWGLLLGLIRAYGGVNEIFAGLGLNYVGQAITNYLILGPWKRAEGATMSGTEPFPEAARMSTLGDTRASLLAIILAVVAIVAVYYLLRNTRWGLRLKAIGLNDEAARRLGIKDRKSLLMAFMVAGIMAGLAGAVQVTAVRYRLIPGVSGGIGYLSQLVVLLSGLRAEIVPLVVAFFAAVQVGSPRLELRLGLDASLGGVLQASVVFFFVIVRGIRQRLAERRLARGQ